MTALPLALRRPTMRIADWLIGRKPRRRISVVHDSMLLLSKGLAVFNKRHSAARSALRFSVGSGHFGQEQVLQALRALALVLAHCDPLARLPIAG